MAPIHITISVDWRNALVDTILMRLQSILMRLDNKLDENLTYILSNILFLLSLFSLFYT